jgi:membrane associated rhomboid family serine protease
LYFFYYIPVGLDVALRRRPIITYLISAVCVILFVIYKYRPWGSWWDLSLLTFQPIAPSLATSITHAYLHGSYFHLIGNLVYLVLFGRAVEDRFGSFKFYMIFTFSAMAGAFTHMVMTAMFTPQYLQYGLIGASGATSGILGAYLVRLYFSRVTIAYWVFMPLQGVNRAGKTYLPVICAILLWFVLQAVRTVMQYGGGGMRVAYGVHIGGFAAGIALAALFGAAAQARAENHLVKARRYFEKADWFGAQAEYIDYLALNEQDARAHTELARAYLCGSDKMQARPSFARAVELLMAQGDRDGAEEVLAEAMRHIPAFVLPETLQLNLACGFERTLKFHDAMEAYERFVWRYPQSADAPFVLLRMAALLERRLEKPVEALACYRRLVDEYAGDRWVELAANEVARLSTAGICPDAQVE